MGFQTVSSAPYTAQTTNDATGHNAAVAPYASAINNHSHDPSSTTGNFGNSIPAWGASNPLYGLHGPGGSTIGNDWSSAFNGTAAIPADPTETAINPANNSTLTQGTPTASITASWGIHGELARIRGAIALLKGSGKNWFDSVTLYSDPMTTTGDLVYRNGSNVTARLPIGVNGQILQIVSGLPTWQNAAAGFTDPTANPGDMIYRNGSNTSSALTIGANGQILQVVGGLPSWQPASVVAASAATTSTLGSVKVDNNMSGSPVAITTGGYLTSITGLTTSNLSASAGITSGQIASVAASTISGVLTKAQQYANTAYLDAAASFSSTVSATALSATGLTGATAASRYVGATASGAPASGTFAVGDWVIDQSAKLWVCTAAGSPGTWSAIAGGGGGSGTVTSVALAMPGTFTVSGSPITSSGTLSVSYASQGAATFLAAPTATSGTPTFRGIAAGDLPVATTAAFGAVKPDGSTITISGGVISSVSGGAGTVTSVGLAMPSMFSVTGSPVTVSGTLTASLANQSANLVFAGPSTGAASVPTFRSLVAADIAAVNAAAVTGTLAAANMPIATSSALGAVKDGFGVVVDGTGVLSAAGGLTVTTASVTASAQVTVANGASLTITLPAANTVQAGAYYVVKNGGSGTNTVVARSGSDTIDGATSYTGLTGAYYAATFYSDGVSAYYIA